MTRLIALAAFFVPFLFAQEQSIEWFDDYGQALSVAKATKKPIFLEFRCELFNATNTPNFGLPSATINTTSVGRIFGVASPARQIQFALRYEF